MEQEIKKPRLESPDHSNSLSGGEMASNNSVGRVCVPANVHLSSMESDFLYHIGYSGHQCKDLFGDVKVFNCCAVQYH